jgi:hypothetical protein
VDRGSQPVRAPPAGGSPTECPSAATGRPPVVRSTCSSSPATLRACTCGVATPTPCHSRRDIEAPCAHPRLHRAPVHPTKVPDLRLTWAVASASSAPVCRCGSGRSAPTTASARCAAGDGGDAAACPGGDLEAEISVGRGAGGGGSCSQNGYLLRRGGWQNLRHPLVNGNHGDSTTRRLRLTSARSRELRLAARTALRVDSAPPSAPLLLS